LNACAHHNRFHMIDVSITMSNFIPFSVRVDL